MDSNVPAEPHNGKSARNGLALPTNAQTAGKSDHVAHNAFYLTIALLIQKALALGYFVYASRAVGSNNIGIYLAAMTVTSVFGYFIDFAFSQVLIREVAKDPSRTNRYLNATLALKFLLGLVMYAAAQIYVLAFHYPSVTRELVTLTGLIMVLDSFTLTFYAIFRAHQRLLYEAIGTVINKILVIIVGVTAIHLGYGVRWLIMAVLIGSAFNILFSLVLVFAKIHWRPRLTWDGHTLKLLATIAVPFAIGGIFITILANQDQILLYNPLLVGARGASYVAWYGTAYKFAFAFQFIPAAVVAAIFPAMSAYFVSNKPMLAKTFERGMTYLLVIGMPLAFGVFSLAEKLIVRIYKHAFFASITPLRLLIFSLLFIFLNYPVGYLLNAANRQTRNTIHVGIVVVVNLIVNIVLIPRFTFIGASISSLLSSALLLGLGLYVTRSIIEYNARALVMVTFKTLLAASSMGVGLYLLQDHFSIVVLGMFGAMWYFVFLFVLGVFKIGDGVQLYRFAEQKFRRNGNGT